ncbi:hypothetical protein SKAU_G00301680 [Synaphobranchus kaupii]|uniref:Immunoglobulin V-set domain-containing protein n=1 Tax=Synaphobranchus kaupii TaxID=118154 RepID=A0A9Q1EVS3_SYNKA|nr:hypothetical protein SKAU_G00301680 [Synaphobranchus kaupii]
MADTLPWMGPNATGLAAEAPKPAFPNDASYWHSIGARPKASTPARTWSDVVHRRGKSSKKSNKRAPTLTPPPQLSLQNSWVLQPLLSSQSNLLISQLDSKGRSHHTLTTCWGHCTLITVLSCVSGVTVVTQKPPILTVSKGDTATMDCNLGTVTDQSARWYKQVPGSAPQFVLYSPPHSQLSHIWSWILLQSLLF